MIALRFVQEAALHDKLIQWYSRSSWNHVDLCYGGRFLGARVNGGVMIRAGNYIKPVASLYLYATHLTPEEEAEFWKLAKAQIGKPYNWRGIVGFAINEDFNCGKSFFCSQYVVWLFQQLKKPLIRTDFADRITPAGLTTSLILKETP